MAVSFSLLTGNVNLWYSLTDILPLVKRLRPRNRPISDYAADVDVLLTHDRPNPPMTQYPPRHITTTLHVSDSTLRRWSEVFARHLSPSATTAPRRYTSADVAVITRIKALSESGMRITEIDAMLDQSEPLPPTESPTELQEAPTGALQTITALLDTLQAQQATQAQIAATLASLDTLTEAMRQIADMRERLARLEAQIQRLDRMQDQIDSIGRYTHDHSIKIGMRRPID